ncbi:N-acylneuraminate-9-phosphate synthase, spore coat polysaccharide biosynthesis protein spsE [Candidatus Magnetobacterium bavaricum]|uniref:N-acylneuraminate-9-phosphate synthase, spore coat polysaccharide biosynthesis protein spsE n=1 Tax=Candidatus Magnetobacterium bavaricum TaxID=29290 RepID=A0A0F3GJI4_9BACT|nr:N-acylneuraminate-9-phosphate synthase, spore coat polysaccharide biosynthesis protein spsE [Candidatus Magnetobacterium bavaricum]
MRVDGKEIGNNNPVYFVAEIGSNYMNFDEAKTLIDIAVDIGVDAVKFQTFEADTITTKNIYFDMEITGRIRQYDLFKSFEHSKDLQRQVYEYAKQRSISVYSAPSHIKDIEFMEKIDVPVYKIGSDLACHIPLLEEVAMTGKPILLSTGLCTLDEVKDSVEAVLNIGRSQIALYHCVSNYPTQFNEVNLRAIHTLKEVFGVPVGLSDHTVGIEISLAAVAIGSDMIERHLTFDKNAKGPDHIISLDKNEFTQLIMQSRNIEIAMGDGKKLPSCSELKNKENNRVSIVAMQDIPKGTIIEKHMIDIRRPGNGLEPKYLKKIIGRRAKDKMLFEEPLSWKKIE